MLASGGAGDTVIGVRYIHTGIINPGIVILIICLCVWDGGVGEMGVKTTRGAGVLATKE